MAMQVLLMTDVAGLGAEGDVVSVADGYARNHLLPRKMAAAVTEATRRRLAKMRGEREKTRIANLDEARKMAAELSKISVTIAVKTAGEEKLYGSVGVAEIVSALAQQGVTLDKNALDMEKPIKELGVFDVPVKLHPDVTASVKVWVVEE